MSTAPVFTRTFNIGPRDREMVLQVAQHPDAAAQVHASATVTVLGSKPAIAAGVRNMPQGANWTGAVEGNLRLKIPAGTEPLRFTLWVAHLAEQAGAIALDDLVLIEEPAIDLAQLTHGGPPRWPEVLTTRARIGTDEGPFAVDVLTHPVDNPWFCRLRLTGLDFFPDGDRPAICDWDGNVWMVSGLARLPAAADATETGGVELAWRRVASGLFHRWA